MRPTDKTDIPPRRRSCSNCGRVGHQVRTCASPPKAHDKIGVEVEGWWMRDRYSDVLRLATENWHMGESHDGSLISDESGETVSHEFKTRPGSLCEAITQVMAIYPDKCDPSAGMHIHMSFVSPLDISALNCEAFFAYYKDRWTAWGTRMNIRPESDFWKRLRGENDYCRLPYVATTSTFNGRGDRYTALNWTAFSQHTTLELRVLPLFKQAKIAASAIEEWVSIVEDYLEVHATTGFWSKLDRDTKIEASVAPVIERKVEFDMPKDETWHRDLDLSLDYRGRPWRRTVESEHNFTPLTETIVRELELYPASSPTPGHVRLFGDQAIRALGNLYYDVTDSRDPANRSRTRPVRYRY